VGGMRIGRRTCPSATLSSRNPIWPDLGSNPGRRVRKPATNGLSCDTEDLFSYSGWRSYIIIVPETSVPGNT
jgi:hypothetical protein